MKNHFNHLFIGLHLPLLENRRIILIMSDYEATVNNFIHLLKTQPKLFSKEENTQLVELLNSQSDDVKSLSNSISDWLEKHPQVDDALAELENNIAERGPGSRKLNSNIPKYQIDKKSLLNAIQQSSESTKEDENKDDKS